MARYIDADALIKKIFPYDVVNKGCYAINAKAICEAIQNAPAADVVPRAEVEKAKEEADRLAVELEAEKTLRVVGIERIFVEIEKDSKHAINFVENHKSYSEEVRQAKLECYKDIQNYVAELKKKYTEDSDES